MRVNKAILVAGVMAVASIAPVHADEAYKGFQAGDIMVRGRMLAVIPDVSSSVSGIGGSVDASNSLVPEVDASYFFTPNFAVEGIAAVTRHHLRDKGSSAGDVDLGHVSLLPPTLTGQWHFMPDQAFSPYVGAGVNYTVFFDAQTAPGSIAHTVKYRDGFGGAVQAGFDYHLAGNWYANVDVKHLFLSTKAKINGGAVESNVSLDPTIVGVGIGYKF
ncbi:MAG: OmpW family outer membrane protein [Alphaproteobacteria bacterium]|nr:OmpW family outer membrane protein [Alphaproteobacteria bacterium]